MKLFTHIVIFIVCMTSLFIAYYTGPIANLGYLIQLNDGYVKILQRQYIYSGLVTAVISCATAYFCKANFKILSGIIMAAGLVWVTLSQLSEPDFLNYLLGAIADFMFPYSMVCVFVLIVLFGVNKKWPRLT